MLTAATSSSGRMGPTSSGGSKIKASSVSPAGRQRGGHCYEGGVLVTSFLPRVFGPRRGDLYLGETRARYERQSSVSRRSWDCGPHAPCVSESRSCQKE